MPRSWSALHVQLLRSTTTLSFHRQLRAICAEEPALAGFADPAALFDFMHRRDGDPEIRNAVLAALVRRVQAGAGIAVTLILLTLWPGLDAMHRRLARHFRGNPDTLVSELNGRVVDSIHGLDLGRVNRIAATLIRNCERDIVRGLQRQWSEAAQHRAVLDPEQADPRESPLFGLHPDLDADAATLRLIDLLTPTIGGDSHLVVAIAVLGERQEDAAAARGLSHETGRKRYQRALQRLRSGFDAIV